LTLPEQLPYQHPERIRGMFGSIAPRYDLANHLLSCGLDFYWRKRATEIVAGWCLAKIDDSPPGSSALSGRGPSRSPATCSIVDLATGTGDLALALQKKLPTAEIIGADFTEEMLAIAKRKGVRRTMMADAMRLPLDNSSVDCVTVAFGLRNMEDYGGALREMARVLKANGHLLVLEFSLPTMSILRAVYRFYLHRCLPFLGSFLTRKKSAYSYLGDSIEQFPNGETMLRLMESSGFANATAEPLTGGIVTIYTADKL
jgi:demethylmenaquinone methyltransferase/2-methoxy-6-polyprenyl-1,4-benzoquinol methylase